MSRQVDSGAVTLAAPPRGREAEGGGPTVTVVIPVYFAEATIGRLAEAVIDAFGPRPSLERLHTEIKRRIRSAGAFPDRASALRLIDVTP